MKRKHGRGFGGMVILLMVSMAFSTPVTADEITIVGEVNDTYQIVADGQIYEVADTAMGDDLVTNYIATKVKVSGTIKEKEGMKIITVTSFEAVPE